MKSQIKKSILLVIALFGFNSIIAQSKNDISNSTYGQNITMSWNKNTPDQEMKDDAKALKVAGVDIKYSNLKRNAKGEIIALKLEYKDQNGNSGTQEYNGVNPIADIHLFKNEKNIGFGQNRNNDILAFENFDFNAKKDNNLFFDFNNKFGMNDNFNSKSKIIIQNDGKAPLIIEDGEVISGGEGYTEEELNKIKSEQKFELKNGDNQHFDFNFNPNDLDIKTLKEKMEKMHNEIQGIVPNSEKNEDNKSSKTNSIKELNQAKEEMIKAKKEMEEARKELQKAKSEIKMRKA